MKALRWGGLGGGAAGGAARLAGRWTRTCSRCYSVLALEGAVWYGAMLFVRLFIYFVFVLFFVLLVCLFSFLFICFKVGLLPVVAILTAHREERRKEPCTCKNHVELFVYDVV